MELGCHSNEFEAQMRTLFGGMTKKRENHKYYEVRFDIMIGNYSKMFSLLEQSKICGSVTSLLPVPWIKEINQKNINISNVG